MKLVRARPKLPEHLPESAFCCPRALEAIAATGEITVDLDSAYTPPGCSCLWCNREFPPMIRVRDVDANDWAELDYLDLDETGVSDGNYVEAVAP